MLNGYKSIDSFNFTLDNFILFLNVNDEAKQRMFPLPGQYH